MTQLQAKPATLVGAPEQLLNLQQSAVVMQTPRHPDAPGGGQHTSSFVPPSTWQSLAELQTRPALAPQVAALLQVPTLVGVVSEAQQEAPPEQVQLRVPPHPLEKFPHWPGNDVQVTGTHGPELEIDHELCPELDVEIGLELDADAVLELVPVPELDADVVLELVPVPVLDADAHVDADADPDPELDPGGVHAELPELAVEDVPEDARDDALEPPSLRCPPSIPASFATSNWVVPQRTSTAPVRNAASIEPFTKPDFMGSLSVLLTLAAPTSVAISRPCPESAPTTGTARHRSAPVASSRSGPCGEGRSGVQVVVVAGEHRYDVIAESAADMC